MLGIVLGSFLTTWFSEEFAIVKINKKVLLRSILGSILMGFGARWAAGCIIGNGMVASAQWSLRGWIALVFLAIGIWLSAYIFIARELRKNEGGNNG